MSSASASTCLCTHGHIHTDLWGGCEKKGGTALTAGSLTPGVGQALENVSCVDSQANAAQLSVECDLWSL